jgi:ADP-ribosylglycohydrolase
MSFLDRSEAAFVGLALGDAYGRPLEFVRGDAVRSQAAGPGHHFMWTDDTHMALYLGRAALQHGPGPLDRERFAYDVGTQFSAWLLDPLTPSTAPGNTCIAGTKAWERTQDWTTSGVTRSDGCGAVMRVVPLPLVFRGEDLDVAAATQAVLTHGHPNAPQAAMAACRLVRGLLQGHALDRQLVRSVAEGAEGSTRDAMLAAVEQANQADGDWLDEASIPAGDGGWRAPSALGLAVCAALRWGVAEGRVTPTSFERAIDKAARIDGDSDSVACLAGMLLGAAGGTAALPEAWRCALPQHDEIAELAGRLARLGQQPSPDVWVAVADLHGHLGHLNALVAHMDNEHGERWGLVTLGDYVDNGPDIPGLLDRLIELHEQRPGRVRSILGNHDLACLRALGWPATWADSRWCRRWAGRYWGWRGGKGSTPEAYGAPDAERVSRHMPQRHQDFLRSLPWSIDDGTHLFVHAGMQAGPLGPQHASLARRRLPEEHLHLPPQVRDKGLAAVSDPSWDRVVVSAHTKDPAARAGFRGSAPHVFTPTRICLSGEVDRTGELFAVELPGRRLWRVGPDLSVISSRGLA